MIWSAAGFLAMVPLLGGQAVPADAQELVGERLSLLPAQVRFGPGTVRLDGMGGFETVVPDENLEINALDFGRNPAGFGDDRDSWTVELRYGHGEYAERDRRLRGNDVFMNEGSFRAGFYQPGNLGVGVQVDYAEVAARDFARTRNDFTIQGFEGVVSKYIARTISLGGEIRYDGETENTFSPSIYNINHDNTTLRGGLGVAWHPAAGVVLGTRGEVIASQVDGESTSGFHTDTFDWSRPGGLYSFHGFVNRGRLRGGVDVTGQELNGDESVRISWSERFVFNPTTENVSKVLDTFAENRTNTRVKTRWMFDVTPSLGVSAAAQNATEDFEIVVNPNIIGSRDKANVEVSTSAYLGGVTWRSPSDRLLLAGELKVASSEVKDRAAETRSTNTLDEVTGRLGGEYFLSEMVVARGGLVYANQDYSLETRPDLEGSYATTRLATGLGIAPAGSIWRLDVSLDVDLSSDLDTKEKNFSAYIVHLF